MKIKAGVSGIRGEYNTALTKEAIINFIEAYIYFLGKRIKNGIVLGRDTRNSGPEIYQLIYNYLKIKGIKIIPAGILPTPSVQFAVRYFKASGGIIITASHNPKNDNGLKFLSNKGIFLNKKEINIVIGRYNKISKDEFKYKINLKALSKVEKKKENKNQELIIKNHISRIKNIINLDKIRKRKFKVVIDACNGAGTFVAKKLAHNFGFNLIGIHMKPTGDFERFPEPIPENLKVLGNVVKKNKADIGFAQDPDADRLAIVDEKGSPIGEDLTLVLAANQYLKTINKKNVKIVTNLSTTFLLDKIAEKYKAKLFRTPIGEINVVDKMIKISADIGGEGNGGVILPRIGYGRDSLTAIGLILEFLASTQKKLSETLSEFPEYFMVKDKLKVTEEILIKKGLRNIINIYKDQKFDTQDGIKIIFKNSWLHVRPSNTEPIVRFIAEAPAAAEAKNLIKKAKEIFILN